MKNILPLFCLFVLAGLSCKKKEEPPKEPSITFIEASPLVVTEFQDSVIVRFSYKDNNGDLGDESPDEYSLEVKDSRLPNPDYYHIQPLAPLGTSLKIEGELKVKVSSMFLLGNGATEITTLTIKLKDREGNWSNEIVTPTITIQK